ncbi:hypothetical protein T190_02465 [Sinorhizobium meliloti CCBAU 01290]|nr:hypothetical protein T190_02465 [Sinorhizobium meliloti CCBAU 01290]
MYLKGELVIQDYARATELICAAAAAGDPNGQFNCGLIYSEGKAVGQDWAKAIDYWQKAAAQHSVAALNYLDSLTGRGTASMPIATGQSRISAEPPPPAIRWGSTNSQGPIPRVWASTLIR